MLSVYTKTQIIEPRAENPEGNTTLAQVVRYNWPKPSCGGGGRPGGRPIVVVVADPEAGRGWWGTAATPAAACDGGYAENGCDAQRAADGTRWWRP